MVKDIYNSGILNESEIKELKLKLEDNKSIIAQDKVMIETLDSALRIARVDSTVLILGKTGVGKEVVANMIWKNGDRDEKPFIRVN
ncbi:MAG: sigma 54-interacting transcriptional regulator, partial [Clostridium sp.]